MAVYYYGSHSITFEKIQIGSNDRIVKNSWVDFHLVPSTRHFLEIPKVQTILVKLPRSNKILDLTNSLNPNLVFEGSTGTWDFMIDHDRWSNWTEALDVLEEYFDGSEFIVRFDDNPSVYYNGALFVSNYTPGQDYSTISIDYDLTWKDVQISEVVDNDLL